MVGKMRHSLPSRILLTLPPVLVVPPIFISTLLGLLLLIGCTGGITYTKCLNAGWIPYQNVKCVKILNIYETQPAAVESCRKQVFFDEPLDINLHSSLLKISSREEGEFFDKLLFNISRYTDNVWLGAVRDDRRAQFRWLDGTSLNNFSVHQKWAYGNPTGDLEKNCVELRSKDNHNFNFNLGSNPTSSSSGSGGFLGSPSSPTGVVSEANRPQSAVLPSDPPTPNPSSWWSPGTTSSTSGFPPVPSASSSIPSILGPPNPNAYFSRDQGNWYNVPCTKHNLVVCEITQLPPEQVVQLQINKSTKNYLYLLKEISSLQSEVTELRRLLRELAANVVTDIKFGSKETTDIWHGPGFPDGSGYLLTGILNWEENSYPYTVSRRKFQKFVNGKWVDVY